MSRRTVYFVVIAFIILLVFLNSSRKDLVILGPEPIKKAEILTDFAKSVNISASEGINTKYLFFPLDYTGEEGNLFYVGKAQGDNYFTEKYLIEKADDDTDLIYILKDTWQNLLLPQVKFETYILENSEWIKLH